MTQSQKRHVQPVLAAPGGPCYCSGTAPGRVSKSPPYRYLQCEVSGPRSKRLHTLLSQEGLCDSQSIGIMALEVLGDMTVANDVEPGAVSWWVSALGLVSFEGLG